MMAAVEMQGQAQDFPKTPQVVQPTPATIDTSQIQYIRLADGTFQAVTPQQILSASAVQSLQNQQPQPQPQQQQQQQQQPLQLQPPQAVSQQSRPRPVMPVAMQGASGVAVSMPQGESLVQMQPTNQSPFAPTGAQRQLPQVPGGSVGTQPAQPPPQLQPPTQLMRPPGPIPPQSQPYRAQQEGGAVQAPPGPIAPPAHAHETLYVDDVPLDMSRRELSHIFRPFGGYKVPLCPALLCQGGLISSFCLP
jgi:hypothetical protein